MEIYAPLAGRMGMQDMRSELENLAFEQLQPDHYKAITDAPRRDEGRVRRDHRLHQARAVAKAQGEGIDAQGVGAGEIAVVDRHQDRAQVRSRSNSSPT
jgi:guanosine-3',5'-bis(diphosphate) 3'-pyrophosphohydrolase